MNQGDVAELVSRVWSDLLDVRPEPTDNFFDLGGYSLLVVDVVRELRKAGLQLSVEHVFQHPVLDDLAAVLATGDGPSAPTVITAEEVWRGALSPWDDKAPACLVPLVPDGTGAPMFCVHWGNGNVRFVAEHAAEWSNGRPVYGFEAAGYRGNVRPLVSIADMAQRYLTELRAVQPHGPYFLSGLCQGALVAYELARRLAAMGERIEVLALINPPSQVPMVDRGWGLDELLRFRLNALRERFGVTGPEDVPGALADMVPIAWYDQDIEPADFYRLQVLWTAGMFAQDHYELLPYAGPVLIFELRRDKADMDVYWKRAAPQARLHWLDYQETLPVIRDREVAARMRAALAETTGGVDHDGQ